MKFLKYYRKDRNKEVVLVTDVGEFPIWEKDYDTHFATLEKGDEIENEEFLVSLAVKREVKKSAIRKISAGNITKNALIYRISHEKMFGVYPEKNVVETVVSKLALAGFINDESYARRFVESSVSKGWGEYKIRASMREKGFEPKDVDKALSDISPDWESVAREYVLKNEGEERDTLFRRLQTRGFSTDIILTVLNGD